MTEHVCEIKQDYPDAPWESDDFSGTVERREEIVRCRDCASIKPTTDGRHYCPRWSHIVPLDGYCWRGEAKSGEEAQEG